MARKIDYLAASPLSSRLDKDKVMMMDTDKAAAAGFILLDHMHTMRPEEAVVGLAVAFAAFAERVNMDPDELHAVGRKVLREADRPFHKNTNAVLGALTDFAKYKVRDRAMI